MSLINNYVQNYGKISEFFDKIADGQAPEKFTQQHLKDIGFASSNYRAYIPLLKALGFLSNDGTPTQRYHNYRDQSQAKKVLGEALKEAYADLFVIKERPTETDKKLIEGKFKSVHNASDNPASLMTKTFFSLLKIADLTEKTISKQKKENKELPKKESEQSDTIETSPKNFVFPGLNYNIQIHLPPTKDIEVYNAIFKSLKEHLIG